MTDWRCQVARTGVFVVSRIEALSFPWRKKPQKEEEAAEEIGYQQTT